MTAIGHDMKFAVSDRGVQLSRMRVPWTRGATSGSLLLLLGAWAALAPFVGPYFNFAYTPDTNTAWHWTAARAWLEVAPGAAVFAGGLLLVGSTNRAVTIAGAWLGIAGGAWLIVGPSLTDVLNLSIGTPDPTLSTRRQALAELSYFYAVGALILFFAAAALGRLSVQSLRDVVTAERRVAQAELGESADGAEGTQVFPAADATAPMAAASAPMAGANAPMAGANTEPAHPLAADPLAVPPTYSPPPETRDE